MQKHRQLLIIQTLKGTYDNKYLGAMVPQNLLENSRKTCKNENSATALGKIQIID